MSVSRKAWIDLLGVAVFLLPLCVLLAWKSFDFVAMSWKLQEASRESGGLPYPMIPLLKCVLVIMPITVGLQGVAILLRCIRTIRAD
jgi:TRAP-type mannitol/chloroaromatic compound transport system permease small subunit